MERIIKIINIEPILKSLKGYKDLNIEINVLDELRNMVINGTEPTIELMKSEEVLSEAKQWLLEMRDYFSTKPRLDHYNLVYTRDNHDMVTAAINKELGETAWDDYRSANNFRSFLRQRLNDAIGFRLLVLEDDTIFDDITLVAFIREPARGKDKIAIFENGEILYKTKFKDYKKAVLLTDKRGYIQDKKDRLPLIDAIKDIVKDQTFRTDDNSIKLKVKVSPTKELQYQITCEDSGYILSRIIPKRNR